MASRNALLRSKSNPKWGIFEKIDKIVKMKSQNSAVDLVVSGFMAIRDEYPEWALFFNEYSLRHFIDTHYLM